MADSLKSKTISALSWSFLESIGLQGVRFFIGIVLARLLFPEQFGLIAMLMIFMAVSQSFLDSGFRAALIQKRTITQLDTCSIFYFNIVVGIAAAGLLCLVAPWIADFYIQPTLTPLTRVLSLVIVINSFGLIQDAIITKHLNFKILTKITLISGTLSGIIGVAMAIFGFGVWSLVGQQVSSAFFRTISLWFFSPWRPAMIFSFNPLREMFGFGSRLLFSDLLNRIFDNIYLLVIGKLFSAADLGFFTRAKTLQEFPSDTLAAMVGRVTFPVFSTIQNDPARLKRGLKQALTTLVLVNFPMMIGLAIISRPLVMVLLTEKWAPCIPYIQLFCVVGLLHPLHVINLNVLTALGRSDLFLRLEIIKKALIVVTIAVTWRWGVSAMICGIIAISFMSYYLNSYYNGVLLGYSLLEQLSDLYSYLITAVLMGMVVYATGMLPFPNYWSILLLQITTGIVVYVCLCRLFRLTAFMEILQVGRNKMHFLKGDTVG
ncbi:MAG: lipopolysaccharide biosynthesis protein [Syntrophaceae bacterium]